MAATSPSTRHAFLSVPLLLLLLSIPQLASANPVFARQYGMSCITCHAAFPRLNSFGQQFVKDNIRLPNWREQTGVDTGDKQLVLPKFPPLAIRTQAYYQARQGKASGGDSANNDFQAPYLIKLLSSAPLSENISYYFYGIMAEKGGNGEFIIEDAWFSYDDLFDTGVGMMFGQFQVSDLMFPRETRLTFQDFIPYRQAGITYERGVTLDRDFGPANLALGVVNGNGIEANAKVTSGGLSRPDRSFDSNSSKSIFGRLGGDIGPVNIGLFGLSGRHTLNSASSETGKLVAGIDASGSRDDTLFWFAQLLWNRWNDALGAGSNASWSAGFVGVDYILDERWALSGLYNYADAGDFSGDAYYSGIDLNSLTGTVSYYFMRNIKGIFEVNVDLLADDTNAYRVANGQTQEGYVMVGFDAAF